jgi:hypothetical protein
MTTLYTATILAIDPGNAETAWCEIDANSLRPLRFAKESNEVVRRFITSEVNISAVVVERVASYGMAVGREVFETCEWVGRFTENALCCGIPVYYVYRKEEKLHICASPRANDANIRRALIDRFASTDLKNGKGTKKNPDWFYGFSADVWAAYAVGLTFIETHPRTEITITEATE